MASSSYNELCREIRLQLTTGFKRAESKDKFATRAMVQGIISPVVLRRFYESLRAEDALPAHNNPFGVEEFIDLVQDKKLRHFLAVLMCAKCSVNAAKSFVQKLVLGSGLEQAQEPSKETPNLLPATEEYLHDLFDDVSDENDFFNEQRPFCTIVVGGPSRVTIHNKDQRMLPWLSEESIGEGSFGVVYKVKVAEGHLTKDRDFNQTNEDPEVIARKDFIAVTAERSFQKEWKAISDIFNSTQTHENIVKSFGTIVTEGHPSTFSLLMPLAEMDLDNYMQQYPKAITEDIIARQRFIKALMGLTDGLRFLHSGLRTGEGGESLICYHMDLKPSNILVFNAGPQMSWKLSDFGLSRVKPKTKADVSDLSRIFKKRGSDQHSKATATANLRGEGTYQPREAQEKGKTMNEKSDIWSLGCIISLLFTFMERGVHGIEPYSKSRQQHSNSAYDVFYQHNKSLITYTINKGVTKQHDKLIEAAKKRNVMEGDALSLMLKWLESKVLIIDQDDRCGAAVIHERLKGTLGKYKNMETTPLPPSSTPSHPFAKMFKRMTGANSSGSRKPSGAHHNKQSTTQTKINQGRLNIEKSMCFNGSDSSLDAGFLVYWNSQVMKLFSDSSMTLNSVSSFQSGNASTYSADSSSKSREQVLTSSGQHVLQRTSQSWKCGAVTERFLIAAVKDAIFKCYIFDIESDKTLRTYSQITLAKIDRGIHKLITPCGKDSFACILHDKDERCSILIAKIAIKPSPQPNNQPGSSQSLLESNHSDAGIHLTKQSTCQLGWSTTEIEHVVLHTMDEVCIVVRRTSGLSLHLFTIGEGIALHEETHLKAREGNDARLFTDMICFSNDDSNKTDVIVVAQKESIFYFTFDKIAKDKKVTTVHHPSVKDYWILKIARSESGSIVALGRHSGYASSYIVLLSVKLNGEGKRRPELTHLAELKGVSESHQPKLSLLSGNDVVAQVTATISDGQYRVYRLNLSGLLHA